MVATIAQLIGKVSRDYVGNWDDLLAKYGSPDEIPADEIKEKPISEHSLMYDSATETLEPVYFFILDLMNDFGLETEKLLDNFTSSPGSGHFSELGTKATAMQQQGTKILGDINTVLRSVLNIIYDLKEFRIRLSHYDNLKTDKKDAALLALKQIWMDRVDIQKGTGSINSLTATPQLGFQTLRDAFLVVKNVRDVDKIDLNDRVKRILRPRIMEFNDWVEQSEKELRKRYELEKNYLRSQVNSLKLYSRWAKPYLKAAQELEMKPRGREPALVTAFNTIVLELTLLGKKELDVHEKSASGDLPKDFEKLKTRKYYSCVLIDFRFRGIPQRIAQQSHYAFGGRAEISFKSYVLNEQELAKFEEELDASDIGDVLRLIEGVTGESLKQIQEEIEFFLEEAEQSEAEKAAGKEDTSNPFKALVGAYDSKPKQTPQRRRLEEEKLIEEPKEKVTIRKENWAEKEYMRKIATKDAEDFAFRLFDVYKKAHGMPSYT